MKLLHDEALEYIKTHRLIAILRGVPETKVSGTVAALAEGGVKVLEFTFDHCSPNDILDNARKIQMAGEEFGSELLIGCGTAMNTAEVDAAYSAGAQLVISPNVSEGVIRRTRELGLVSMPGALSSTEIVSAYEYGADIVKLFPAGELGLGYIKAVRGPLSYIPMAAVGGVKPENIGDFLSAGICSFGIGGQLVLPDAIKRGDYGTITARAREFVAEIEKWEQEHV